MLELTQSCSKEVVDQTLSSCTCVSQEYVKVVKRLIIDNDNELFMSETNLLGEVIM